jgi:RNA polymerase sigma factor (TIGR02999 family)
MSQPGSAVDALFTNVYSELRVSAHLALSRGQKSTLNTTLLVHELYLRMRKSMGDELASNEFAGKGRFFSYAGKALRSIMVDHARSRMAECERIKQIAVLQESTAAPELLSPNQALGIDSALKLLELEDPRAAKVVELHFFAGLTLAEIAQQLELTTRTIDRDWRYARAFLHTALVDF